MKTKAIIPLIAGLCIGGVALKMGLSTLQKAQGAPVATTQIWAAKDEIQRGAEIDETMLTQVVFPAKLVPPGAITDKKTLLGRVPRTAAPAGLPILETMLLPPGSKAGIWVKPGFRAVAVKIDESSGVDNHLQPGCHVDVVGYFTVRQGGRQETIARTIIENVEVAAVGARINAESEDKNSGKGGSSASGGKPQPARAVTLLVKPEQVPTLHLAEQRGKIKLSMRGDEDQGQMAKNVTTAEQDIVGLEPENAKNSAALEQREKSMWDKFTKMFESREKELDAKLEKLKTEAAPPAPAVASAAAPAWTMTVWNGNQKKVLGWTGMDSIQAVEIQPAAKAKGPEKPAPQKSEPHSSSVQPTPSKPTSGAAQTAGAAPPEETTGEEALTVDPDPDPEPEERSE